MIGLGQTVDTARRKSESLEASRKIGPAMTSKNIRASISPRLARVLYGPLLAFVSILIVLTVFETGLRYFASGKEVPMIERLLSPEIRLTAQLALEFFTV